VLELAAGAGDTGFEAAVMVSERGRLISTDFSPEMVQVARRRGDELGLRNVDYRVMDAERIELDADSVDGVLCRFGYMLMADPAAALSETRRVLRPDGRLTLSVWSAPERNPWITILARILVERGHMSPPEPGAPDPFSMASEERTRTLLRGAGFTAVRTEEVGVRFAFRDIDDYLSYASDTPAHSRSCSADCRTSSAGRSSNTSVRSSFPSSLTDGISSPASLSMRQRAEGAGPRLSRNKSLARAVSLRRPLGNSGRSGPVGHPVFGHRGSRELRGQQSRTPGDGRSDQP
jgi:hypothetical protein